ncbi:hypothetical protein GQ44DRAFT_700127 [Phaeosphaeriaceae sp. PMI808]|nr:hypothetical protein GQ44DRAFT_700127 [Phaeosphaeriaceae sp. PMI808]
MDASMVSLQARLASFQGAAATKSRRSSSRSKKAAPKSKAAWPYSSPSAEDLAFAGFVWRPTSASPDNVQCFSCTCQLDGWEEADVPAYEHLTHSPNCGFAMVTCIRLRHGDPGRTEEDPVSEPMIAARRETFGDLWPLDTNAGYPSAEQLVAAGWYYDPADGTPDGVTCPYCSLSLDAWDAGDDPMEEHRRRSSDCLFFSLAEFYHPAPKPAPKKAKRATKAKRASTRSSTASTTTTTTKKSTRGKKRGSQAIEESSISETFQSTSKRMRYSDISDFPDDLPVGTPKKMPTEMDTEPFTMSSLPDNLLVGTPKKTPSHLREVEETHNNNNTAQQQTEAATEAVFTMSSLPSNLLVGTPKRTPSHLREVEETHNNASQRPADAVFTMSSLPSNLLVGTPKRTPSHLREAEEAQTAFTMSSLPDNLLVGTPKKTPSHLREVDMTHNTMAWQPTDIDAFFHTQHDARGFVNNIMVDAGLDELTTTGTTPEDIQTAVLAGLTDHEKEMNIEQWVMYNAKRGEEKLRAACEQQILAFEAQGKRALAMLEAIPTY